MAAVRGRRRAEDEAKAAAPWGEPFIIIAGAVVSGAILIGFFLFSPGRMQALADGGRRGKLSVSVIGHNWWWEVRYPNGAGVGHRDPHPDRRARPAGAHHRRRHPQLLGAPARAQGRPDPPAAEQLWLEALEPGVYRTSAPSSAGSNTPT